MIEFKKINLEDKALFDRYLYQYQPQISEMTFTNLFMWRYFYKFRYAEINGYLCLISVPEEGTPYAFMPIGEINAENFTKTILQLKDYFVKNEWKLLFKKVAESELSNFKAFTTDDELVFDRDNSDYIHLTEDLSNLAGKKFDGKRNHINKFKKLYDHEYVTLGEEHMDECHRIMDEWCAERDCKDHKGLYCEKLANLELLNNYVKLGCTGALIKVDGKFCAFTVGEMLNSNTAVIHIEKASSQVNGLYTFINQQFCKREWQSSMFINREQDLGKEGLRKAKLSYNPYKMINKYTVNIK
jgi:uncharacterized protein